MEYKKALEYLQELTYDELVKVYIEEYMEWKRTGILQDGVLRDFYNILCGDDEHIPITYADKVFNEWLAEIFAMQNNDNNSLENAVRLMNLGFRVTHKYFMVNEYLYMEADGNYYSEEGVCFDDWVSEKKSVGFEKFQTGWKVYN